jgi:hypothetical protein
MKRLLTAAFLLIFCLPVRAEPQTGHFHNPARPGSGVSLHRSGDTIFATVLEYDAQNRPTWLFASNVRYGNLELDPGGSVFEGRLYEGSGTPMLSTTISPFTARDVGRISMWEFQGTLTVTIMLNATCPTCEPQTVNRQYVKLM